MVFRDFTAVFYDLVLSRAPGAWRAREWLAHRATPLVPRSIYDQGKKLNLGSSSRLLPGYVNVDMVEANHPDVVADVAALTFAREGEYDLVRASHVLEHFAREDCPRVLAEWRRVLRGGGYLVVCCPDYTRLSWRALLQPAGFDPGSARYRPREHGGWMAGLYALDLPPELRHKTVFTHAALRRLVEGVGFHIVGRQVYQVEPPSTLGIEDDSCSLYSINLVARKVPTGDAGRAAGRDDDACATGVGCGGTTRREA